jgi:hypothetical protein
MSEMTFDEAEFYSCQKDEEKFSATSVIDALKEYFETPMTSRPSRYLLRPNEVAAGGITVYAFDRVSVELIWMHDQAEILVADFEKNYAEEYGDMNGDSCLNKNELTMFANHIENAIYKLCKRATPWKCEVVGARMFTMEEVDRLLADWKVGSYNDEVERYNAQADAHDNEAEDSQRKSQEDQKKRDEAKQNKTSM